jgi:hypothetical protein
LLIGDEDRVVGFELVLLEQSLASADLHVKQAVIGVGDR